MALLRITDFDSNYQESFNGNDIKGDGVYTEANEKIGTINDILVDEEGHFRYFIVDLGFWIFGKQVLLPVGRSRIDYEADRVYAVGLTREQAEALPEFNENMIVDYDYEERVRGVYRNSATGTRATNSSVAGASPLTASASLESSAPLDAAPPLDPTRTTLANDRIDTTRTERASDTPAVATPAYSNYNRDNYTYQQDPSLYGMNDQDHQNLRLYEERLIANKRRVKTGEVAIGKHVETDTERISVPVEKERVVVERVTPADAGRPVAPGEATFREGEVAHVELYEETPEIRKEAVVREEVRVKKVADQETVSAEETVRREELDIDSQDTVVNDRPNRTDRTNRGI